MIWLMKLAGWVLRQAALASASPKRATLVRDLAHELEKAAGRGVQLSPLNKALMEPGPKVPDWELWQYSNPADMPTERYLMYAQYFKEMDMGLSVQRIIEDLLKPQQEALKAGESHKALMMNQVLETYLLEGTDRETLYRLASVVFVTPEQDHSVYDADYEKGKIEAFRKAAILDSFFLPGLCRRMIPGYTSPGTTAKHSLESLKDELAQMAQMTEALERSISSLNEPTPSKASAT